MAANPRLKAQIDLILQSHDDATVFPEDWEDVGEVDYLYRKGAILVRQQDRDRVTGALNRLFGQTTDEDRGPDSRELPIPFQPVVKGVLRMTLPSQLPLVPAVLDALDADQGAGLATPDLFLYVSPYACPADEPGVVPGTAAPFPPPAYGGTGSSIPRPGHDGDGVFVSVVDTGLLREAADDHSWLNGVDGVTEDPYDPGTDHIRPYASHGTFVTGVLRCAAPRVSAFVERAFDIATGDYESALAPSLEDALNRSPDVLVFTFTTSSRHDLPLLTFDHFYATRIRYIKGLVVLAPAGNDGKRRPMWPASYPWVVSVGALSANWRERATFSNFGGWVDVFAPGQDLVNAYAKGTYVCVEPPVGQHRHFHGMARWSGTSFSTPIVAGLIAARMSATGENGQQAADALLKIARDQAVPGVGAVLYPGQDVV